MFSFSQKHVAWNQKPGVLSKIFRKKKSLFLFIFFYLFFIYLFIFWFSTKKKFFFWLKKFNPLKKIHPPHFRFIPPNFLKYPTPQLFQDFQNPLTPPPWTFKFFLFSWSFLFKLCRVFPTGGEFHPTGWKFAHLPIRKNFFCSKLPPTKFLFHPAKVHSPHLNNKSFIFNCIYYSCTILFQLHTLCTRRSC